MKQQLSDLMDGELDAVRSDAAWKSLSSDTELRDCWRTYHLIGDYMRGEVVTDSVARAAPTDKIMARLADEPTVLSPGRKAADKVVSGKTRIALAMAASVATLSVVGILALRQEMLPQALVAQKQSAPSTAQVAAAAPLPNVNDYLVLHRQFANRDAILPTTLVRDRKIRTQGAGR
jgi:sigma-E factor negative regulatory protein RseA